MSSDVSVLDKIETSDWMPVTLGKIVRIATDGITAADLAAMPEVHHYSLPAFDVGEGPEIGPGETIKSNKTIVPNDCVLFSKLNPRIPRIWRVSGVASQHSYCSTEFWPLVARGSAVDLDYLSQYLSSGNFLGHPEITPSSSTNSHQRIDRKAFEQFEFLLPPLDEQRQIAEVLRSVDEVISCARRVLIQASAAKAAERRDAFGACAATVLDPSFAKQGWWRTHLGTVFRERKEKGLAGLPIASVSIEQGLVYRADLDRRVASTLPAEGHSLVRKNDLAYNMMRMWQGACGIAAADCLVSPAYVVMTPGPELDPRFAHHLLRSEPVIGLLHAYSQGIVDDRLRLYPQAFGQIPINLPPVVIQQEMAELMDAYGDVEAAAAKELDAKTVMKAALMSDLLSGYVRVPG
jgi:restriction endonuclease S subunit